MWSQWRVRLVQPDCPLVGFQEAPLDYFFCTTEKNLKDSANEAEVQNRFEKWRTLADGNSTKPTQKGAFG
jgi:hypothetical protein